MLSDGVLRDPHWRPPEGPTPQVCAHWSTQRWAPALILGQKPAHQPSTPGRVSGPPGRAQTLPGPAKPAAEKPHQPRGRHKALDGLAAALSPRLGEPRRARSSAAHPDASARPPLRPCPSVSPNSARRELLPPTLGPRAPAGGFSEAAALTGSPKTPVRVVEITAHTRPDQVALRERGLEQPVITDIRETKLALWGGTSSSSRCSVSAQHKLVSERNGLSPQQQFVQFVCILWLPSVCFVLYSAPAALTGGGFVPLGTPGGVWRHWLSQLGQWAESIPLCAG